jgi:hypothetical protein
MQTRPVASAVVISHHPDAGGYLMLQDEDMASPGSHHTRGWVGPWESKPVGGQPEVTYRPAKNLYGGSTAAECTGRASRRVAQESPASGHVMAMVVVSIAAGLSVGRDQAHK